MCKTCELALHKKTLYVKNTEGETRKELAKHLHW